MAKKEKGEGTFVAYQAPAMVGPWNPMVKGCQNSKEALQYALEHGTPDALCQVHNITTPVFRITTEHHRKLVEVKDGNECP